MKFFKWKIFIITSIVSLSPILFGVAMWNNLSDTMAIHFNIYGRPDGYASKAFVVFGLPVLMVAIQGVCCFINDINAKKHGDRKKLETVTKWIIPCMTVALQIITIGYDLKWNIDINKSVSLIVGIIFLTLGNYLPKFDYIKNYDIETEKARKINRFIGYETVVMGILFLTSIFLPPMWSVACLLLLIPYAMVSIIYSVAVIRK